LKLLDLFEKILHNWLSTSHKLSKFSRLLLPISSGKKLFSAIRDHSCVYFFCFFFSVVCNRIIVTNCDKLLFFFPDLENTCSWWLLQQAIKSGLMTSSTLQIVDTPPP
jgi:hypothetical protein